MLVIVPAIIMILIGAYAHMSVAPGAASIPLHWSFTEASMFVPRLFAFGFFPVIGIAALLLLSLLPPIGSTAMILVSLLLIGIQLLHIGLTYRWFAKTRA